MKEIYVIEKLVIDGVWEIFSNIFYTNEKEALDICTKCMKTMQTINKEIVLRVTKLKLNS